MRTIRFGGTAATCLALATFVVAAPGRAQSADEQSAYRALIYTTVAGLPPLAPGPARKTSASSNVVLQGRVGHMSRDGGLSLTTYGLSVELPMGRASVSGTLAYLAASCGRAWEGDSDCAGDVMLGGAVRSTVAELPLGGNARGSTSAGPRRGRRRPTPNEPILRIGVDGSVGFSPRQGQQAIAAAAALPVAVVIPGRDVRVLPFLSPGLGYGRMGHMSYVGETPRSYGSIAFMIGGGLGVEHVRSGIGATVGFQRVLKSEGGTTQLGLGMTWQGFTAGR